jgi:pyrroline-5-carboxylate reductase
MRRGISASVRVGVIGLGTMGRVLVQGILDSCEGATVVGSTRSQVTAEAAAHEIGIRVERENGRLADESDVIILCVKPQQAQKVLEAIAPQLDEHHLLVSICAALTLDDLRRWSGGRAAIIRAMPNTPCQVREGMSVFAAAAYVFVIIEALSEAGVKLGISRSTSVELAAQTLLGAAKMVLERGAHPAALKDEVTTPAGCTIDGLMALEDGKLRSTLISGVLAAASRSKTLREPA